jgi:hypothetical protein
MFDERPEVSLGSFYFLSELLGLVGFFRPPACSASPQLVMIFAPCSATQ